MPWENELYIVGIGPGAKSLRTRAAEEAILKADFVVGYRPYLDLIPDLLAGKKVFSSGMGKEVDRVRSAVDLLEEGSVALVSSGDPNVYGLAGLGLEMADPGRVQVVPGVTSFTAAACRAGLVFRQSVAVISLSDLLVPWPEIEGRLRTAAEHNMPIAIYNPRSKRRDWQLIRALDICGEGDVLVAKNVSRDEEEIFWTTASRLMEDEGLRERIDMTTLVILCGRGAFRGETRPDGGVNVVGIGPGDRRYLTGEAESLLAGSEKIFGAERYLQQIADLPVQISAEMVRHNGPCPERMAARLSEAEAVARQGKKACILTGGDPSIFSAAWRVLQAGGGVHLSAGVSAFSAIAARAGAPLVNDFALLSEAGEASLAASLAGAGFGVAIYNCRGQEISTLLQHIHPHRPCILARDVSRPGEEMMVLRAEDLLEAKPSGYRFTIMIASARAHIKEGKIITQRGYETKYRY